MILHLQAIMQWFWQISFTAQKKMEMLTNFLKMNI